MHRSIMDDRPAQLLLLSDSRLEYDEARLRLEKASIRICVRAAASTPWGQAALMTLVRCAVRMFRGGVYLECPTAPLVLVGAHQGRPLIRVLVDLGCRRESAPEHAASIFVGTESFTADCLYCWADGWAGFTSPKEAADIVMEGNVLGGAIAGALAASESFRLLVLGDRRAGKREQRVSALFPGNIGSSDDLTISLDYLPTKMWLLGLGNLGQASLWILSLLPYHDPQDVVLQLQDVDIAKPENLDVQLLTTHQWIGKKKARMAAEFAESRGFSTVISEQRFTKVSVRSEHEPNLILCGVDNLETRRAVAREAAEFALVIDAGLGGSATEVFDIRIHGFPGDRSPEKAWPLEGKTEGRPLPEALQSLINAGRLDACGALTIAGQSMGIPSTAVIAAVIQVGQVCRAIATRKYCALVDLSLRDLSCITCHEVVTDRRMSIAFQRAA